MLLCAQALRSKEESDYRLAALQEKLARIDESHSQQLSMSRNHDDSARSPHIHFSTHREPATHSSQMVCVYLCRLLRHHV
jgi:hypothetical protein